MSCDLCGSTAYELIWDKEERQAQGQLRSVIIPGHIHSKNVMCKSCGLVYVNPKMSRDELDKFYSEDYRKIYGGKHSLEAEKRHAETAYDIIRTTIKAKTRQFGNVLDVGCSTGELLGWYVNQSVYGIEPNKKHAEIAKNKGLNVENTSIEHYNPGFKFDIITMLNALEHVYSPTEVLNKIYDLLNDDGYVLICVPNLYNRTIHISVDAFLSNAHLYNFSIDTLTSYFLKCGFKIVNKYQATEEIGDKIYLLGQKVDKKQGCVPKISPGTIQMTKEHLKIADAVWSMKYNMTKMGFK